MSHASTDGPRRHRLTVADYYRMGESGILAPDARVELIDGEMFDMAPTGSLHAGTVKQLADLLRQAVAGNALLQIQDPVALDDYSEPQPDLVLLRRRADFYKHGHPQASDVLLLIEVAETSLSFDRNAKIPLYAQHGIHEAWLVDVRARRLIRYRDVLHGAYARVDEPDLGQPIEVAALPEIRVDLSPLFST